MTLSPSETQPVRAGQPGTQEKGAVPDRAVRSEPEAHVGSGLVDPEVARFATEGVTPIDKQTNKRLKRLIDRHVLVILMVTYFLQSSDKNALPLSAIMGIRTDAHLVGQEYSWLTTVSYIAIFFMQYPTNMAIQRLPIAKYLATNIMLRGITLSVHAACDSFVSLVILRVIIGALEACTQPAFMLLSSLWYKRKEQSATIVYWLMMNGLQAILSAMLAYGFSHIPATSPIRSWQALFLSYGILTFFWGVFVFLWMPDSPMRARCFTEEDKKLMMERVRDNKTGVQNKVFRKEQVWEAFTDFQTYAFAIIQICTTVPSGGIGAFANILVQSFGFTTLQTQLLSMVQGTLLVIVMLSAVYLDRRYQQTTLAMLAGTVPAIAGTVVLLTVRDEGRASRIGLLLAYYAIYSFWACCALALSLVTRNVAGQTKKSTVIATNFVAWAAGNSVGPQTFQAADAPRYTIAFSTIMGCWVVLAVTVVLLRFYYKAQNRAKERASQGEGTHEGDGTTGFEDITDKENPSFRYMY